MSTDHGSRLRDLIARWRHLADYSESRGGTSTRLCADELAALLRASASAPPEKEEAATAEERTTPLYHCERCQMALPERLMTFGIGVRGGDASWCAACKPPAGDDGAAKRAEVIALRKAAWIAPGRIKQENP